MNQKWEVSPYAPLKRSPSESFWNYLKSRGWGGNVPASAHDSQGVPLLVWAIWRLEASSLPAVIDLCGVERLEVRDKSGNTPLMITCAGLAAQNAQALIEAGADVNAIKEGEGELDTPLFMAIRNHPELVPILLNAKANPNLGRRFNETPLAFACRYSKGDPACVRALIKHGALVNPEGPSNPLSMACEMGYFAVAEVLLEAGASPEPDSWDGVLESLALLAACRYAADQPELVRLLLKAGARRGLNEALWLAAAHVPEVVGDLLDAGASKEWMERNLRHQHNAVGENFWHHWELWKAKRAQGALEETMDAPPSAPARVRL